MSIPPWLQVTASLQLLGIQYEPFHSSNGTDTGNLREFAHAGNELRMESEVSNQSSQLKRETGPE